jgi:hypothetical protein
MAAALPAAEIAKNTEFKVKLTAPLSTETNKKGDKITAMVASPAEWQGAVMEGVVKESKSGNKFKGTSTLLITFQTLVPKEGAPIDVSSDVKGFTNSKGKANVDEEGQVIEKKNNLGKVAAMSGAGALIGALAGGGKGAAIGAGVGAGAAIIAVQLGAKAPNIRFDPGAEIILSVSPRR